MAEETAPPLPADREDLEPEAKNGRRPGDPYDVGYGKPPKTTRWKKGQSGYPPGRPKKRLNQYELLEKILQEEVAVTLDGERVRMTRDALRFRALHARVLKGEVRAFAELEFQKAAHVVAAAEVVEPILSEATKARLRKLYPELAGPSSAMNEEGNNDE